MRDLVGAALLAAAVVLTLPQAASAESDVTIEKKTTTTSPSGKVVIENETSRTFRIEGETRTFVAPPDIDLRTLNGKEVTVIVDPNGNVTKVVRKTTTIPDTTR